MKQNYAALRPVGMWTQWSWTWTTASDGILLHCIARTRSTIGYVSREVLACASATSPTTASPKIWTLLLRPRSPPIGCWNGTNERATHWAAEANGPDYRASTPRLEILQDEYGSETYQVRVYYRGPLRWGGDPRAIRVDVTRDERLIHPPAVRRLTHPYSDAQLLARTEIACYTLAEVMAEKVRAVCGQRRFAISRDIYDIHRLARSGVTAANVVQMLPAKFEARGLDIEALTVERVSARRTAFENDWNRRLSYLVRDANAVTFDAAWETTMDILQEVEERMTTPFP